MTGRVDSWKEIAAYLKRGTRTVQRWEREEGLPVHRLQHDKLGSVYAFTAELDAWWASRLAPAPASRAAEQTAPRSVAVLPFTDMSQEGDQSYFCEGIAEEMIAALSKINGLRVSSRMSSFRFKQSGCDVREIGRVLHAATVLEGSVRKANGHLRIAVRLTDTNDGFQMWAETYDRQIGDIFVIQEEIARSVAHTLEVTLSARDHAALRKVPTKDTEAYDLYLRGRAFYYRYGPSDMAFAIQLFSEAVARDPEYPLAYAGLADCWSYLYLYSERSPAILEKAEAASRRAVELDPESSQAQASRALALSLNRHDEEARRAFERAIELDPYLFEARYFYARHAFVLGEAVRAAALYEDAMRVRPEDYQSPLLVAQTYEDLGRLADAKSARLRGIELAEEHLRLYPDDVRAIYMAANGMAALGRRERAREWADRALAMRPEDSMVLYNIGCIYSLLGDVEDAISVLERAVSHGLKQKGWFEHDNNLDPLRAHPRFRQLLRGLD